MKNETKQLKKQINALYKERNAMVRALTMLYPAHLQIDADEPNWPVVCIHIPVHEHTGDKMYNWIAERQVTWHIPKKELKYFTHLEYEPNHWDGHTTNAKYMRLESIAKHECKSWWQFWK